MMIHREDDFYIDLVNGQIELWELYVVDGKLYRGLFSVEPISALGFCRVFRAIGLLE